MSREQYEDELRESLSQLETCLETPVLAGELPSWVSAVQDAFAHLAPLLFRQVDALHPKEFEAILEQDPGLAGRVDQLRDEDRRITAKFGELKAGAERLSETAQRIEPDEGQLEEDVSQLVDSGIALVVRVRKQETAITTWLFEAFERDAGTAD